MITIRTERMELHALSKEQLSLALNDGDQLAAGLQAHVASEIFSPESRQAMLIKISRMEHIEARLHPWYTYFLLVRSNDRRAMGVCGFKGGPSLFGSVELGYAIHDDYRGCGYMTEAVQALVDWAFTHDTCRRVIAETLRENIASQRVLQKARLELERSAEHMLYWKIDRRDWEARQQDAARDHSALR